MDRRTNDKLDPKAHGKHTSQVDFDRNREGIYGGLPKARNHDIDDLEPRPLPSAP